MLNLEFSTRINSESTVNTSQENTTSKTVKVYHGTSLHYKDIIETEGFVPKGFREHIYVTTDYEVAKNYAFIWTGGLLHVQKEQLEQGLIDYPCVENEGVIFTIEIPSELLIVDDYNLEDEPNQFKIKGIVSPDKITNVDEIYFYEFSENNEDEDLYDNEILRAKCLLIGVSGGGED